MDMAKHTYTHCNLTLEAVQQDSHLSLASFQWPVNDQWHIIVSADTVKQLLHRLFFRANEYFRDHYLNFNQSFSTKHIFGDEEPGPIVSIVR